jgi:hypothetical protein
LFAQGVHVCYFSMIFFRDILFVICFTLFEHSSHEEIDVSHPDFFSSAKLNGYTPPNKEVIFVYAVTHRSHRHRHLASKSCGSPQKAWLWIFLFSFRLTLDAFGSGQGCA